MHQIRRGCTVPRSDYVYLAMCGELPIAAFTVKFELYEWIKRQSEGLQHALVLMRVNDGAPAGEAVFIQCKQLIEHYEKPGAGDVAASE